MSDFAVMPLEHYDAACDAVRAKTKSSKLITSDQLAQLIQSINEAGKTISNITCEVRTASDYLLGDANNDGVVNEDDVTQILQYAIMPNSTVINIEAADLNNDGMITNADAMALDSVLAKLEENQIIGKLTITFSDNSVSVYLVPVDKFTDTPSPILQELTVTENGEYTPPDGVDGFDHVIVDVESDGGDYRNDQVAALIERSYSGEFVIPDGTKVIGFYALANSPSIVITELPESVTKLDANAFRSSPGVSIRRIPDATKTLEQYCFCYCDGLTEISLPAGIDIKNNAFFQCANLKSVTFRGNPVKLHSSGFGQCTAITAINVPWAEGEVDGAPWGAINATINYNYMEG